MAHETLVSIVLYIIFILQKKKMKEYKLLLIEIILEKERKKVFYSSD